MERSVMFHRRPDWEQPEDAQSWDLNSFVGESQAARKILDEVRQIQRSNQTKPLGSQAGRTAYYQTRKEVNCR